MNEKAEFAVKKLKEYARQQGFSTRNTSDLSTLEQWLIIELLRVEKLYIPRINQQSEMLGCEHNVITITDRDEGKCDDCGIKMIRNWQPNCG